MTRLVLGEDGPTHQPIEQLNMLRLIPNSFRLSSLRYDGDYCLLERGIKISNAPSFICLSRQNLPQISNKKINLNNFKGAYTHL